MNELYISTGENRSKIIIKPGVMHQLSTYIKEVFPTVKVLIVTDRNVDGYYGESMEGLLEQANIPVVKLVLPPGEKTKSFEQLLHVYDFLGENRFTRSDAVMALGGGVIGDLAGYAAATWQRGMNLIQVPTTLLAQIDSSIGGKTAIDTKWGKNMVGAFKQPGLVCIDPLSLKTLPDYEMAAGMAEMIKYACIWDRSMFELLQNSNDIIPCLPDLIVRSCNIKKAVVEEDSLESGKRMILNFGHTVAHVLEGMDDYEVSHGFAVAMGMVYITRQSERQGLTKPGTADQIRQLCIKYGLPVDFPSVDGKKAGAFVTRDKKARSGKMNLVLLHEIGSCFVHNIDVDRAADFLGWRTD